MAKPIPINRRWIENQKAHQESGGAGASAPAYRAPRPNHRQTLRELLEQIRGLQSPEPSEIVVALPRPIAPTIPTDPEVIAARYEQVCAGCGELIRAGMPIARHPLWREWVHADCRSRQQRAARRVIAARYAGVCRSCTRPVAPGQLITRQGRYGWVHLECAAPETE